MTATAPLEIFLNETWALLSPKLPSNRIRSAGVFASAAESLLNVLSY